MSKVNTGQASSTLIPKYIGSDFDKVVAVADNIEQVVVVSDNIEDVGTVADNINYVKEVAEDLHGMPVTMYTGENPPVLTPMPEGVMWYCTTDGRTYVWYTDADSGQWVESAPQSAMKDEVTNIFFHSTPSNVNSAYRNATLFSTPAPEAEISVAHNALNTPVVQAQFIREEALWVDISVTGAQGIVTLMGYSSGNSQLKAEIITWKNGAEGTSLGASQWVTLPSQPSVVSLPVTLANIDVLDAGDSYVVRLTSQMNAGGSAVSTILVDGNTSSRFGIIFNTNLIGLNDGIRDGVTTSAPTENAVYDALASREALLESENGYEHIGVGSKIPAAPMLNLKQWLNDEVVNVRTRFGVSHTATERANTDNLQAAYDELGAVGGGILRLPSAPTPYFFAPSVLNESYDNYGAVVHASGACISARQGVMLIGDGVGKSIFQSQLGDVDTTLFHALSPIGGGFRDITMRGNGSTGGAGHGVFNCNLTTDPEHAICKNWYFHNVEVSDVCSYGIGIDNGDITNVQLSNIYIHNVGADGIDTKQRGPRQQNIGMHFNNILVDGFGYRLTGQAGLDFHGVGMVTNLTVRNMGLSLQTGLRYRTMAPANTEGETSRMSRASNIIIQTPPSDVGNQGITMGSSDGMVQGAVVRGVTTGVVVVGNTTGSPERPMISNIHAIDCAGNGIWVGVGTQDATIHTAYAINCGVGFRNNGDRTTMVQAIPINCTTNFVTSSNAAPSERKILCDSKGITENSSATSVTLEPRGADNLELRLMPRGTSRVAIFDGSGARKIQVDQNGVGFNGGAPAPKMVLNPGASDAATTTALVNQIRIGLIRNGLAEQA